MFFKYLFLLILFHLCNNCLIIRTIASFVYFCKSIHQVINRLNDNVFTINLEYVKANYCNQSRSIYLLKLDHCISSWPVLIFLKTFHDMKKSVIDTEIADSSYALFTLRCKKKNLKKFN